MNLAKKSIKILKDGQLKNGGILATEIKGAYPYVYTRDGVIVTKAFNKEGLHKNSEKFYYFLNKFSRIEKFNEMFHRFHAEGWPCVTRKRENDNLGLVVHGIYDTYKHNEDQGFLENMWLLTSRCISSIFHFSKTGLLNTERSIHEFYRLEHGHEIWSNCAACRALYDGAEMAKILGHEKESRKWELKAKRLEKNIKNRMFNKKLGVFMKNTRYPEIPDISQLAPFYFNLIDSKRVLRRTMKHMREYIWHKDIRGFGRFRKFEICKDWHWYTGGSGSWTVFTIWGARFYKEIGDRKKYKECADWVERVAKLTKGLLPEHIATNREYELWKENETEFNTRVLYGMRKSEKKSSMFKDEVLTWALPLAWAHAEYILLK